MEVIDIGPIKRIAFPSDWLADSELNTGLMKMLCVHPPAHSDIEITFFQKMQGVNESAIRDFREILMLGEHKIVESGQELLKLAPIMGNAGNNQWSNKNSGRRGPNFRFSSGEIVPIQGRPVLKVKGSFMEPETKQLQNEYCGIFIDSGAENNIVHEVYLQVPSNYGFFQFEQYLKVFTDALSTLTWS